MELLSQLHGDSGGRHIAVHAQPAHEILSQPCWADLRDLHEPTDLRPHDRPRLYGLAHASPGAARPAPMRTPGLYDAPLSEAGPPKPDEEAGVDDVLREALTLEAPPPDDLAQPS